MKIQRVYVLGNRHDLRYTQSCVASIRRWYPDLPISLVKDELGGAYDTRELEQAWAVAVAPSERRLFGGAWGRLVPLLASGGERCLILDSDIVFVGRVLERLEASDADFVVESRGGNPARFARNYFDLEALQRFDRDYVFPGWTFNSGQIVATSGVLRLSDLEPFIDLRDLVVEKRLDLFNQGSDQGVLNYVLAKRAQLGEITLERIPFVLWGPGLRRGEVRVRRLTDDSPYPYVVHWAGSKRKILRLTKNTRLVRHFEAEYYARVPGGRRTRLMRAAGLALKIALGKETLATRADHDARSSWNTPGPASSPSSSTSA